MVDEIFLNISSAYTPTVQVLGMYTDFFLKMQKWVNDFLVVQVGDWLSPQNSWCER